MSRKDYLSMERFRGTPYYSGDKGAEREPTWLALWAVETGNLSQQPKLQDSSAGLLLRKLIIYFLILLSAILPKDYRMVIMGQSW